MSIIVEIGSRTPVAKGQIIRVNKQKVADAINKLIYDKRSKDKRSKGQKVERQKVERTKGRRT